MTSVQRSMQILEAFDSNNRNLSLSDLVKTTGLNRSAVQRFLYTLESLGYLKKDQSTKRFGLTPKVMSLGYNYLKGERLVEIATPLLLEARKRTGNAVYLGTLYETDIIYLVRLPQRFLLLESTLPGRRVPAFCSGRAILAHLPDQEVEDLLRRSSMEKITPFTIVDIKGNMDEVDKARKQGYVISSQEQLIGEIAISSAVVGRTGTPLAAVYVSVNFSEWSIEKIKAELVPVVIEVAGSIGAQF
ncbi:transcriptional regulator, IclR family [Desulfopila aestuarii DSM 18488]|uniref:Transcriptional regulator, IclR family n=1 Tax=Desulfopila aestuarii DSM 18488 TaxID=1121416 RepID=A0A1M7YLR3_9BACT|nr:transcriptional regulator, IclR family [Desulfopila aestuarii DSM 18488]